MHIQIPAAAARAISILEEKGYEAYLVGGCVRDACRGTEPHDWDLTTSAMPGETMEAFSGFQIIETGLKHGTVTVLLDGEPLEITTFRDDGEYADHRHPEQVTFVRDIRADLQRRDFTVNAMAYSPRTGLIDPFGGREDLEKGVIRAVGQPEQRFEEDALRILRGIRFASVFGFAIDPATLAAMGEKAGLLVHVSSERVLEELKKMMVGSNILSVLLTCGEILRVVLPEIGPCIGFAQNNRHHIYDVWQHTAHAVAAAPADRILRLAMLFHDVGKPDCYSIDEQGEGHFYGHAQRSVELTNAALHRLKSDTFTREEVTWLVASHDYTLHSDERTARRLLSRHGEDRTRRLLQVKIADSMAHSPDHTETAETARALQEIVDRVVAEAPCLTLKELAVKGGDLMALGYAGPEIGHALESLLEAVIEEACPNEKEALLARLSK